MSWLFSTQFNKHLLRNYYQPDFVKGTGYNRVRPRVAKPPPSQIKTGK